MLQKNETPEMEVQEHLDPGPHSSGRLAGLVRVIAQTFLMVLILFGGFFVMNGLISSKEEPPKRPPFKSIYTVDTVVAEAGTFQPNMIVYGEVQAAKTVDLRSLVAGKIVEVSPALEVGGRVDEGELLFRIDKFNFETALQGAIANSQETKARISENEARIAIEESRIERLAEQLQLAETDYQRILKLEQQGNATPKSVEDRSLIVSQRRQALEQSELNLIAEKAKLEQLRAVLTRFEWSVAQAERDLEDTVLRAPMTGIVSENNAAVGRLIGANDMVVSMYRSDQLDVRFTLTDQRFGRIQSDKTGVVGREIEVIWIVGGEEFRYPAVIDRISAQIASNRGGVEVLAGIRGDILNSALRPGAFVEVVVPDKAFEKSYRVPETALYDGDTVYVSVDGKLQKRQVKVEARDGDFIILTGEITDGDIVMTTRIAEISEGLQVRSPDLNGQSQ